MQLSKYRFSSDPKNIYTHKRARSQANIHLLELLPIVCYYLASGKNMDSGNCHSIDRMQKISPGVYFSFTKIGNYQTIHIIQFQLIRASEVFCYIF